MEDLMTVFARRTRLVSFRVSEEEYAAFRAATIATGARSVSAFARSVAVCAVEGGLPERRSGVSRHVELMNLRLTVQSLQMRVEELAEQLNYRKKAAGQQMGLPEN